MTPTEAEFIALWNEGLEITVMRLNDPVLTVAPCAVNQTKTLSSASTGSSQLPHQRA